MLLLRRKGQTAPFTLLTLILLFGRKKTEQEENKNIAEPVKKEAFPIPDILKKTITSNDASRSRDRLRLASLERDIIGDAHTKIYEAETKDRKSTRLNSSHVAISYAVFCLKKKKKKKKKKKN